MSASTYWFRPRSPAGSVRLVMLGACCGTLALLILTMVLSWRIGPAAHAAKPKAFDAPEGSCLDWNTPDARNLHVVNCAQRHLFEITGKLRVAAPPSAALPTEARWQQITQKRCVAPAQHYLGYQLDPQGKYSVGALMPSAEQWSQGDRTLRCGLQVAAPSGRLLPTTGSARGADQSAVYPPGTCLGLLDKSVGDPINCGRPHSYEIVGIVDLRTKLGPDYPSKDKQQQALLDACTAVLDSYAHGVDLAKDGLTLTWDTRSKRSWQAGSTKVNCKVGAPLPDGSGLKPVINSIRP